RPLTTTPLAGDLMVTHPHDLVKTFADAGVDALTVHDESDHEMKKTLQAIRDAGVRPGVVLNPATPLERAIPYLGEVDLLLLMTVHPGFAGQAFRADVVPKIQAAREHIDREGLSVERRGARGL